MSSCYRWGQLRGAQVKVSKLGWVLLPLMKATVQTLVCLVLRFDLIFWMCFPFKSSCDSLLWLRLSPGESLSGSDLQCVCGKTANFAAALGCDVCNQQSPFLLLRKTNSHYFLQCWLFTAFTSQGFLQASPNPSQCLSWPPAAGRGRLLMADAWSIPLLHATMSAAFQEWCIEQMSLHSPKNLSKEMTVAVSINHPLSSK